MLVARDLTERPIEECATPLCDADGRTIGMVLAFRDISDALRVQEERASAGRLESLGLLAGGIAHDFNNILMAIMGNISMARATTQQAASAATALAEAEQACVRARQITWQLLTFSKGGVPVKKTVAIARVLEEAASLALRGSNVTCTFDLSPDLWPIEADEAQLVQVFTNLLINAQQAMPHGGVVTVRAENVFELTAQSKHALRVEPGAVRAGLDRSTRASAFRRSTCRASSIRTSAPSSAAAASASPRRTRSSRTTADSSASSRSSGRGTTMEVHFPAAGGRRRPRRAGAVVVSAGQRPSARARDGRRSRRSGR